MSIIVCNDCFIRDATPLKWAACTPRPGRAKEGVMIQSKHDEGCFAAQTHEPHTCPQCGFAHGDCREPERFCSEGCRLGIKEGDIIFDKGFGGSFNGAWTVIVHELGRGKREFRTNGCRHQGDNPSTRVRVSARIVEFATYDGVNYHPELSIQPSGDALPTVFYHMNPVVLTFEYRGFGNERSRTEGPFILTVKGLMPLTDEQIKKARRKLEDSLRKNPTKAFLLAMSEGIEVELPRSAMDFAE